MDAETLHNQAFDALSQFMRDRMCLIDHGTGNLFSARGKLYVATCHHVAASFFADSDYRYIVLRNNERIPRSDLKLVASKNDEIDVALVEILRPVSDYPSYTLDDVEIMDTYEADKFDKIDILITGVPDSLDREEVKGTFHTPVTFLTLPDGQKMPSSDFLYCRYVLQEPVIDTKSGNKRELPPARGLSGAFMLKVKQFKGQNDVVWSSRMAKVVAVQHSWDKRTYIKGTNIKHLIDLLPNDGGA